MHVGERSEVLHLVGEVGGVHWRRMGQSICWRKGGWGTTKKPTSSNYEGFSGPDTEKEMGRRGRAHSEEEKGWGVARPRK